MRYGSIWFVQGAIERTPAVQIRLNKTCVFSSESNFICFFSKYFYHACENYVVIIQ